MHTFTQQRSWYLQDYSLDGKDLQHVAPYSIGKHVEAGTIYSAVPGARHLVHDFFDSISYLLSTLLLLTLQ